jgi:hypothetical protein
MVWISFLSIGVGSYNPLHDGGYNISGEFNSTGFNESELDSGGFFSGILGVFNALSRVVGLVFFGLTPAVTGLLQVLFSLWASGWTLFTIGFIIDSFWSG